MRLLRSLFWCAVLGGLSFVGLLFLIQNLHAERLVFFGLVTVTNFALVLVGAAVFGFLLALLLIVPGRIATALYARALDRELVQLERQVAQISEQRERLLERQDRLLLRYERLFADHDKTVAERDRMRAQLAAALAAATVAVRDRPARPSEAALVAARARREGEGEEAPVSPLTAPAMREVTASSVGGGSEVRTVALSAMAVADAMPAPPTATAATSRRVLPPVAPTPASPASPAPPASPTAPSALPVASGAPPIATVEDIGVAGAREEHRPSAPPMAAARVPLAEHASALRHQVEASFEEWRVHATRMRRSAGARYNEVHKAVLARVRAIRTTVSYTVRSYVSGPLARRRQDIIRRVRLHLEREQTRQ